MLAQLKITVAAVIVSVNASMAIAQCACGGAQTAYIAPSYTGYAAPSYTAAYAPAVACASGCASCEVPATQATYYAPAAESSCTTCYAPTTTYYAPTTAYYAPTTTAYYAPAATTAYYAPATTVYYALAAVVGSSVYGTAKVYVPGQPVRNALRAITP